MNPDTGEVKELEDFAPGEPRVKVPNSTYRHTAEFQRWRNATMKKYRKQRNKDRKAAKKRRRLGR